MPPALIERRIVQQIAEELERLATRLREFPAGEGNARRGTDPAAKIVTSLQKVSGTLEKAASQGSLSPAGFTSTGREFESIGATLRALGSGSKTTTRKATKKTTRR